VLYSFVFRSGRLPSTYDSELDSIYYANTDVIRLRSVRNEQYAKSEAAIENPSATHLNRIGQSIGLTHPSSEAILIATQRSRKYVTESGVCSMLARWGLKIIGTYVTTSISS
jgi:hypothetical protein